MHPPPLEARSDPQEQQAYAQALEESVADGLDRPEQVHVLPAALPCPVNTCRLQHKNTMVNNAVRPVDVSKDYGLGGFGIIAGGGAVGSASSGRVMSMAAQTDVSRIASAYATSGAGEDEIIKALHK